MSYEFKLPDIGEGLTEGEVTKWLVKVGDTVAENQPLCTVLTDKAEVEIPSPKAGTVTKLYAQPGEKVKVHAPLIAFDLGGGKAPTAPSPAQSKTKAEPKFERQTETAAAPRHEQPSGPGAFSFKLPDIGEGLTEGEIVKWHVKVGDTVKENQPLANVLTDKAEVEIPSPKAGKIVKLHAEAGQKVKVHAPLVDLQLAGGAAPMAQQTKQAEAVDARGVSAAASRQAAGSGGQPSVSATPKVRQLAKQMGIDLSSVRGTGPDGRVLEQDVRNFSGGSAAPARPAYTGGPANATPAVKQLAAELGVDLSRISGTGPGGRIAEWDVRNAAPAKSGSAAQAQAQAKPSAQPLTHAGPVETAPFVGIRRKIAEKMSQSVHTVAHVTHMDECDMTALVELREKLKKDAAKKNLKLTYLPFIIKAICKTLKEFPLFNAALDEAKGEVVKRLYYNVGIAVNAGQGLVVPNIKGADGKDLWALAAEVSALAEKVRAGKIDVPSLQGGTFTITNIGPLGGLFATPIVNHPEVAILGLMKLQERPVVRDGKVQVRSMMNLVLSFDHRIVDGADAAQFMNSIIKHLENPRTLI